MLWPGSCLALNGQYNHAFMDRVRLQSAYQATSSIEAYFSKWIRRGRASTHFDRERFGMKAKAGRTVGWWGGGVLLLEVWEQMVSLFSNSSWNEPADCRHRWLGWTSQSAADESSGSRSARDCKCQSQYGISQISGRIRHGRYARGGGATSTRRFGLSLAQKSPYALPNSITV